MGDSDDEKRVGSRDEGDKATEAGESKDDESGQFCLQRCAVYLTFCAVVQAAEGVSRGFSARRDAQGGRRGFLARASAVNVRAVTKLAQAEPRYVR